MQQLFQCTDCEIKIFFLSVDLEGLATQSGLTIKAKAQPALLVEVVAANYSNFLEYDQILAES